MKSLDPIKIALLAVGGDGGGVLTGWITQLAENNGYFAQYTYIAGVAQRTGATVYYIELFPTATLNGQNLAERPPVLSQMPGPQDVDILMATELMEAGRSIQRGFVSKKTTMIFSTNRNLAIREKENAADGIADGSRIFELTNKYAKKSLFGNLKVIATKNGSVISSSLFGALAASGTLPFTKEAYIEVIKQSGGKGIPQSINSFNEGYAYIQDFIAQPKPYHPDLQPAQFAPMPAEPPAPRLSGVFSQVKQLPPPVQAIAWHGVLHLVDFQDIAYAEQYVKKVHEVAATDNSAQNFRLTQEVAKHLAVGMAYDDLIFVADEKTKKYRQKEVYQQVGAKEGEIVNTLDYLHPGYEEVVGFLPVGLGKRLSHNQRYREFFKKHLDRDRRMHSTGLFNFLMLYVMGGLRGWRLKTLRHHEEMENITDWLERIQRVLPVNYELAVAIAHAYRLKKGYGDTYHRGHSKYALVSKFAEEHMHEAGIEEKMHHLLAVALQKHDVKDTQQLIAAL